MPRFYLPKIIGFLFFSGVMACDPQSGSVGAHPRSDLEGAAVHSAPLPYADTSREEYQQLIRNLDSFYRIQQRAGFNGSVLIGHKGKVVYERYFGMANRESKQQLTPRSAVQLASISKTMTAAAVLYLYEKNYLDIDDSVHHFLPEFPYRNITLRMLLNHRAGLPDYLKWVPIYRKNRSTPIDNRTVLDLFARHKPALTFRPDTRFQYSNSNYLVLASVIEAVTEMPYAEFMQKYLFEPLGMRHTFVYNPAKGLPESATISYKYNWVREPDMFADGVYGDKGIYSTVRDIYRWDQSFYHQTLLREETIELAYGPCSFEKPGIKNYGLGWRMICHPDGEKIIYHNGWWHGNNTVFYRYIQDNLTIIILGNKYHNNIYRQQPAIYNLLTASPLFKNLKKGRTDEESDG